MCERAVRLILDPKRKMPVPTGIWLEHWDCGLSKGVEKGSILDPLAGRSAWTLGSPAPKGREWGRGSQPHGQAAVGGLGPGARRTMDWSSRASVSQKTRSVGGFRAWRAREHAAVVPLLELRAAGPRPPAGWASHVKEPTRLILDPKREDAHPCPGSGLNTGKKGRSPSPCARIGLTTGLARGERWDRAPMYLPAAKTS
jgi:hypothetical protein